MCVPNRVQKVERTKRALVALQLAREGQGNALGSGFAAGFNPNEQHATTAARGPAALSSVAAAAAAVNSKAALPGACVSIACRLEHGRKQACGCLPEYLPA